MSPAAPAIPTATVGTARPTFIDLFCGCGGFTLGMLRAGFDCLAAVDFNKQAVATLKANLADKTHPGFSPVRHALQRDLTQYPPAELAALIGTKTHDEPACGEAEDRFGRRYTRSGWPTSTTEADPSLN